MRKTLSLTLALGILAFAVFTPAFAQTAVVCSSTRTVAAGDWLSKIAAEEYGDGALYFPIFSATNSQVRFDNTFQYIDNPDQVEIGWKLCVPVEPVAPEGLNTAALEDASYKSDYGVDGVAKLDGGKYSAPAAPGSASMNTVDLTNLVAYGDLNGTPSAAVITVDSGGGSGVFYNLHVMQVQNGVPTDVANIYLGDRVNVTSLYIQDNKIVVGMTQQGPDDPMCCATQRVVNTYTLNGNTLELSSSEVVGTVEQEAAAPSETPTTEGTATPSPDASATPAPSTTATPAMGTGSLTGVIWTWQQTLMNDGTKTTANDPSRYRIQFNEDGTIRVKADCNNVGGTYTTDGNQLTIALGPSTLIACPPDSQADVFTQGLSNIGSYLFDGDNLVLEIKLDSGTMTFAPMALPTLTGNWDVVSVNNGNQAVVSLATGTSITLNFGEDGTVSGNAGCNTYSGTYEAADGKIKVSPLASTRMACAEQGVMEQETQFLTALQNAATYEFNNVTLTLRDASGATQVIANPAAATTLAGTNWDVTSINNGNQAVVTLVADSQISLSFGADDRLSGNAGCNTYNGPYESTETTLTVGPLINTLMACLEPAGVMDQETQFLAALQKAATYDISGSVLTIRDAEGAMQVVASAVQ